MEEAALPPSLNPNNFPAKLWRLVNSPRFPSIRWDARGEGVLIDQPRFESELLGGGAGDAFKTKNFCTFIRQLNLYGFHKVIGWAGGGAGPGPGPGPQAADGDGGGSAGPLHHFQSPHFRRGRPDLLVKLKRLTKANKAKMAAGVGATRSLPERFPQLVGTSLHGNPPSAPSEASGAALITVGHQPYSQDNFCPYSNGLTSSQNHSMLTTKCLNWTPPSSRTWQGSHGLFLGHETSPASARKGIVCSVLQRFPTEVTYTVQPVSSILPLQQGSQTVATSLPKCSSDTPPVQNSQACSPPAEQQCSAPPAHIDPLTDCADPAASIYTDCSLFQGPPVQSPCAAEFPPSSWQCNTSDGDKTELTLEEVLQMVDEMCAPLGSETVTVQPAQEGLFSPEQESTSGERESSTSETEERQLTAGTEAVNESVEETCVKPKSRKRRHSSDDDEWPDLHLLVDAEWKWGCFAEEETSEKCVTTI